MNGLYSPFGFKALTTFLEEFNTVLKPEFVINEKPGHLTSKMKGIFFSTKSESKKLDTSSNDVFGVFTNETGDLTIGRFKKGDLS